MNSDMSIGNPRMEEAIGSAVGNGIEKGIEKRSEKSDKGYGLRGRIGRYALMSSTLMLLLIGVGMEVGAQPVQFRYMGGRWSHARHVGWHRYWGGPTIGFYYAPSPVYVVPGYLDSYYYSGPDFWYSDPSFGLNLNLGGGYYGSGYYGGGYHNGHGYRGGNHGEWHGRNQGGSYSGHGSYGGHNGSFGGHGSSNGHGYYGGHGNSGGHGGSFGRRR